MQNSISHPNKPEAICCRGLGVRLGSRSAGSTSSAWTTVRMLRGLAGGREQPSRQVESD